jgi:hypothetical protein
MLLLIAGIWGFFLPNSAICDNSEDTENAEESNQNQGS